MSQHNRQCPTNGDAARMDWDLNASIPTLSSNSMMVNVQQDGNGAIYQVPSLEITRGETTTFSEKIPLSNAQIPSLISTLPPLPNIGSPNSVTDPNHHHLASAVEPSLDPASRIPSSFDSFHDIPNQTSNRESGAIRSTLNGSFEMTYDYFHGNAWIDVASDRWKSTTAYFTKSEYPMYCRTYFPKHYARLAKFPGLTDWSLQSYQTS
ncbi:hypothetical protein BC829DRAFT_390593 [Chytridium lagenaria]|nr:hypothetical protein BC829DRAFT_390593 [Chytridium lagenaria]